MRRQDILILEDSKNRIRRFKQFFVGNNVEVAEAAPECIKLLESKQWDYLFMDHDLLPIHYAMLVKGHKGVAPGSGRDVAKYLAENPDKAPSKAIIIHSLNGLGSQKMFDILDGKVNCRVKLQPYNLGDNTE